MTVPAGPARIDGLLVDVDGTLLHGDRAIPGAARAIGALRERCIPFRFSTNTTRKSRADVAEALVRAGISATEEEIVNPSILARRRILESGGRRVALLCPAAAHRDFAGTQPTERAPDWVVVGDLGSAFTWEVMNRAFHFLRDGAKLLALHKNRSWHAGDRGVLLDAGPFVAALEYACGVEAEIVGKPSRAFYELALAELGVGREGVLVVGDDPENDCAGGAAAGCRTALVRTGRFSEDALRAAAVVPDLLLDSIASLEVPGR